jgi:flagellar protein FliS
MWDNVRDAYIENRILSASPLELACLLYEAAIQAVRSARHQLATGDIPGRSGSITRACEILVELAGSLNHEAASDLTSHLAELYVYMHGKLMEANFRQSDEPLAEVLGLLTTLAEGWEGAKKATAVTDPCPAAAVSPWAAPAGETAGHAWSF